MQANRYSLVVPKTATRLGMEMIVGALRERHNALADVENFCTGSAVKLKRYAPLLRHVAKMKADIRKELNEVEARW